MRSVVRIKARDKSKAPRADCVAEALVSQVDARVAMIQALIPLGLEAVHEALTAEVDRLAGPWYRRAGGQPGLVRWSRREGSVYLADQKLPITYTRVRNQATRREVPLATYEQLRVPRALDAGLFRKVLQGLQPDAQGDLAAIDERFCLAYERCLLALDEGGDLAPCIDEMKACLSRVEGSNQYSDWLDVNRMALACLRGVIGRQRGLQALPHSLRGPMRRVNRRSVLDQLRDPRQRLGRLGDLAQRVGR